MLAEAKGTFLQETLYYLTKKYETEIGMQKLLES